MDNYATEDVGPGMGDHERTEIAQPSREDPQENSGYRMSTTCPASVTPRAKSPSAAKLSTAYQTIQITIPTAASCPYFAARPRLISIARRVSPQPDSPPDIEEQEPFEGNCAEIEWQRPRRGSCMGACRLADVDGKKDTMRTQVCHIGAIAAYAGAGELAAERRWSDYRPAQAPVLRT
jgi:hypothetical protein